MFKKIAEILGNIKIYIWAVVLVTTVLLFFYGTYIKISETIPTEVYALETRTENHGQRIVALEMEKNILNRDLTNLQNELLEIKQQIFNNQKETRASLKEINRDIKYILKNI
jgi:predicted  nucleic acid-binding Zn-ribbon protein